MGFTDYWDAKEIVSFFARMSAFLGLYCMTIAFQRNEDFYPIAMLAVTTFLNCLDFEHSKKKNIFQQTLSCLLNILASVYMIYLAMDVESHSLTIRNEIHAATGFALISALGSGFISTKFYFSKDVIPDEDET